MNTSRVRKCKGPRRARAKGPGDRPVPRRRQPGSRPCGKFPRPAESGGHARALDRVAVAFARRLTVAADHQQPLPHRPIWRERCTSSIGRITKRAVRIMKLGMSSGNHGSFGPGSVFGPLATSRSFTCSPSDCSTATTFPTLNRFSSTMSDSTNLLTRSKSGGAIASFCRTSSAPIDRPTKTT